MSSILVHHTTAYNAYFQENHDWSGTVVRVTALIFTGDAEDTLQCLEWISRLSPWCPLCFCDQGHYHLIMKVPLTKRDLLNTIRIVAWISNYILKTQWDVITHPTQHDIIVPPPCWCEMFMCTNCHHKGSTSWWWIRIPIKWHVAAGFIIVCMKYSVKSVVYTPLSHYTPSTLYFQVLVVPFQRYSTEFFC